MPDCPSKRRYDADNTRFVGLKLNRTTDADILDVIESAPSIQGEIKRLIRIALEKQSEPQA